MPCWRSGLTPQPGCSPGPACPRCWTPGPLGVLATADTRPSLGTAAIIFPGRYGGGAEQAWIGPAAARQSGNKETAPLDTKNKEDSVCMASHLSGPTASAVQIEHSGAAYAATLRTSLPTISNASLCQGGLTSAFPEARGHGGSVRGMAGSAPG